MPALGCHLSTTGGFYAMGKTALAIGADTFQFFTRNPRGGKAKQIDAEDVGRLLRLMKENGFSQVIAHAPYTLNPCGSDPRVLQFAEMTMKDDLLRMEYLPHQYYNFHPGSHVGQGTEEGIRKISELLNRLLTKEQTTTVLLETMAGKGSEVGGTFGEIRQIIDRVQLKDKIGVCLDTCHVFDAGYDIVSHPEEVLADFDREIGLENLKAVHLNDSKNCLGSHRDRHECIGKGMIGLPALKRIFRHPALQGLPFCLETPNDLDGYREEIRLLRLPGRDPVAALAGIKSGCCACRRSGKKRTRRQIFRGTGETGKSMRYYIADSHFLHEALNTRMDSRGFPDAEAMDEYMISRWNGRVRKNDEVIILGDLIWSKDAAQAAEIVRRLNGKKYLLLGNHDAWAQKKSFDRSLFKDIASYREFHDAGRKVICCHYPILCYNGQYRQNKNGGPRTYMVYGHVHDTEDQRDILHFASYMRKRQVDRKHDGHPTALECNMLNCFCMYSDYVPWTLDEWISYYGLQNGAGEE